MRWGDFEVLPGAQDPFGADVIAGHYRRAGADIAITLCDVFMMDPAATRGMNVVHWLPVDCSRMGEADAAKARAATAVIAMSRFGQERMRDAGYEPFFIPHGVDTTVFAPPADRRKLREELGFDPDDFLIGINAANKAGPRKGIQEQMIAFSRFHERHPKSKLMLHLFAEPRDGGLNVRRMANLLGVGDAIMLPDQYSYVTGMMDFPVMAKWYGLLDVLSNASYGEGFGIPILEAQACGTPVVVGDWSSMPELCGAGWKVGGEEWYIDGHDAMWMRPFISSIDGAYESAWGLREAGESGMETAGGERTTMAEVRERARKFALQFDADEVLVSGWKPVLDILDEKRPKTRRMSMAEVGKLPEPAKPEGKRDLLLIVPSRGRPENVKRLIGAVAATATMRTDIVFGFDLDDPDCEASKQAVLEAAAAGRHVSCETDTRMSLAEWTNRLALAHADAYTVLGSFGDDHEPQTEGWDAALLKALEASGPGFAYPNDKVRDDIPEAVVVSSEIVTALGYMVPGGISHFFCDNAWADLGRHANCITYLPDVIVEHQHHLHKPGEIVRDATYRDAETSFPADMAAYEAWKRERFADDVKVIQELRAAE